MNRKNANIMQSSI